MIQGLYIMIQAVSIIFHTIIDYVVKLFNDDHRNGGGFNIGYKSKKKKKLLSSFESVKSRNQ